MGINVRVQDAPKQRGIIAAQVKLEKDLRDCMRCKFFYGNNSQCLAKKCVSMTVLKCKKKAFKFCRFLDVL